MVFKEQSLEELLTKYKPTPIHIINLPRHTKCTTTGVNCNVKHGLWVRKIKILQLQQMYHFSGRHQ
jgi:hypothetical protein